MDIRQQLLEALCALVAKELNSNNVTVVASSTAHGPASSSVRHERLKFLYDKLLQLIVHEGRFVSERTNALLVTNTIFLTGFVVLLTQTPSMDKWILALQIYIPIIALFITAAHSLLMARTINAMNFWRSSILIIERDSDFWYPSITEDDTDLDIISARGRYWKGQQTKQSLEGSTLSSHPVLLNWLNKLFRDPNDFYALWLPALFGILWLIILFRTVVLFRIA